MRDLIILGALGAGWCVAAGCKAFIWDRHIRPRLQMATTKRQTDRAMVEMHEAYQEAQTAMMARYLEGGRWRKRGTT